MLRRMRDQLKDAASPEVKVADEHELPGAVVQLVPSPQADQMQMIESDMDPWSQIVVFLKEGKEERKKNNKT